MPRMLKPRAPFRTRTPTARRTASASSRWRRKICSDLPRTACRGPGAARTAGAPAACAAYFDSALLPRGRSSPSRAFAQVRLAMGLAGAFAHGRKSEGPGGVISPFCEADIATSIRQSSIYEGHAAERGHRVDHEQGIMPAARMACDRRDVVDHARCGVDLHREHRLDAALLILSQAGFDLGRSRTALDPRCL